MKYFTSDTHFSHSNIIKYCNRPYADAGEMDRALIENWNAIVKPEDTVYHMGDVAFASPERTTNIVNNLNGYKILILGNHDRAEKKMLNRGFQEVQQSLQIELEGGVIANLSHYPYRGTDDPHHKTKFDNKNLEDDGRLLLNGHVHTAWDIKAGKYKNWMINVGVDVRNYKPVSETELLQIAKNASH